MAWTEITRSKYQRDGLRYASDTTDTEWSLIEPHPPPASPGQVANSACRPRISRRIPRCSGISTPERQRSVETINHIQLMDVREAAGREACVRFSGPVDTAALRLVLKHVGRRG